MSPQPLITPPPKAPRQYDDPSLSSLYAELSSLYPELYSYSFDSNYYSSLLASYSADLASIYSEYSYSIPDFAPTTTAAFGLTDSASSPTNAVAANGGRINGDNKGGLSMGAKIGIAVGVPLAVALLAGIGIFLWCAGKRKGKKTSTTIVAPAQPAAQGQFPHQPQPQMGYVNNQGYMQGYPQQMQTPPPNYMQPHPQPGNNMAFPGQAGYAKGPEPGVMELEQEYHFARPGVVEMGDGVVETKKQKKDRNAIRCNVMQYIEDLIGASVVKPKDKKKELQRRSRKSCPFNVSLDALRSEAGVCKETMFPSVISDKPTHRAPNPEAGLESRISAKYALLCSEHTTDAARSPRPPAAKRPGDQCPIHSNPEGASEISAGA
ncbi:hypothetical protein EJ04DRAFT_547725 [Polyplosphaeria fusca]|uniref:Uncharacterized protein n=1 Tax=Polyplosphaeria fusca TaxID=682080 RepID=A0A9P4VA82_9PLEO|nr:hypothetical protein EJ04DRAFT_547725 [Polyplosphaeria fusca]